MSSSRVATLRGLAILAVLLVSRNASAGEPEPVRLEVAPSACVDLDDLRADLAELGARFRDASPDEPSRTFRLEVTPFEGRSQARLVVRDLVFRETSRATTVTSCREATRSLALFVALALDEAAPAERTPPAPRGAPPAYWPEPSDTTDGVRLVRAGRRGSGGLVLTAFGGAMVGDSAHGMHGYAAVRVGRTRLGASVAVVEDHHERYGDGAYRRGRGTSGRIGAVIGWGAPWNDSVVGFVGELGVERRSIGGVTAPRLAENDETSSVLCGGTGCYDGDQRKSARWTSVAPFLTASIVFQVPVKSWRVRPVFALGNMLSLSSNLPAFMFTAEAGLVWQAW